MTTQPELASPRAPAAHRPFPGWITAVTTALTALLLVFPVIGLTDHDLYETLSSKDGFDHTGVIEHLTVLVLLPGIAAGFYALVRYRRRFGPKWRFVWLLAWTAACVYFAGEECSWGQWYLGFETPAPIAEVNKQDEFNLHNTSSWLNEKPRALVEIFIFLAGLVLPVFVRVRPESKLAGRHWSPWVLALPMCWAAAGYFALVWVLDRFDSPSFRTVDSELRELAVAWFLSLYLISYAVRLARTPALAGREPAASPA